MRSRTPFWRPCTCMRGRGSWARPRSVRNHSSQRTSSPTCPGQCERSRKGTIRRLFERFHTSSEDETIALGEQFASRLPEKCVVLLSGNLGAGKTTMAKGIAKGLGIDPDGVSGPTFTLIHKYLHP